MGARYLLVQAFKEEARTMMRMGVGMLAVLGPLQLLLGDQHGLNALAHQPAKIAAMEAAGIKVAKSPADMGETLAAALGAGVR